MPWMLERMLQKTYPAPQAGGSYVRVRHPRGYQASPMAERCGLPQVLATWSDVPSPCSGCGATNFNTTPRLHSLPRGYELTEADATFLRCQRIDPEDGF